MLSVLRVTNSDYPLGIFKLSYTVFGTSHTFLLLYPCRILLSYRVGRFISSVSPFWYSFKNQNVKRFCPYLIAKCVIVVYRQVSSILAIFRTKAFKSSGLQHKVRSHYLILCPICFLFWWVWTRKSNVESRIEASFQNRSSCFFHPIVWWESYR